MAHGLQSLTEQDRAMIDEEISSMCAPYNWHTWRAFVWMAEMSAKCPVNDKREAVDSIFAGEGPNFDWERAMRLCRGWSHLPYQFPPMEEEVEA